MNSSRRSRLRTLFLAVCLLAAAWTVLLIITGGFRVHITGRLFLSSRGARNPGILAIVSGVITWMLSAATERRRAWVAIRERLQRQAPRWVAPLAAGLAASWVVFAGVTYGSHSANGADCYGYVSQAHLWATGTVRIEQPFVRDMHWPSAAVTLAPLGYRVTDDGQGIVPMFPPGLPLTMSLFERVGGREAVFLVVPLLGGLAVWATYAMGRRLAGPFVGVFAALLLATSPTFLIQLMFPMTDVPVAAWWAISLALLATGRRWASFGSGLAAGAGFVTRLNLGPLAIVPLAWLLWQIMRGDQASSKDARTRTLCYVAGLIPACVGIAWINQSLYGSPLVTGLGTAGSVFDTANIWGNLTTYPAWLIQTQTPVVLLALITPALMLWRRTGGEYTVDARTLAIMWLAFAGAVFAGYLLYLPHDVWFWLRYVLPAFPPIFVLTAVAIRALVSWLPRAPRTMAMMATMALLVMHGITFAQHENLFAFREGERKARAIGEFVAAHMSDNAVFVSVLHSGSIRYYSGRLTVRYDVMEPAELDGALQELRRLGYHPYLLLEPVEEDIFKRKFAGYSKLASLDWTPYAELKHSTMVHIFDPADQDIPSSKQPPPQFIY